MGIEIEQVLELGMSVSVNVIGHEVSVVEVDVIGSTTISAVNAPIEEAVTHSVMQSAQTISLAEAARNSPDVSGCPAVMSQSHKELEKEFARRKRWRWLEISKRSSRMRRSGVVPGKRWFKSWKMMSDYQLFDWKELDAWDECELETIDPI